jgi:8-oxo-dGTP pyrophosphatase MutT (NUDIX family)
MMNEMLERDDLPLRVQALLNRRTPRLIEDREGVYRRGSVLIPLLRDGGEYKILFTKRTDTVEVHKGQMSFPGGRIDEGDRSLLDTALRETEEEIGLLRQSVVVLGRIDDVCTLSSDYIIHSFVGQIPYPYPFRPNSGEVEKVIQVPLKLFFGGEEILPVNYEGRIYENLTYTFDGEVIWGATARIMRNFVEILLDSVEPKPRRVVV